MMRQPLFDCPRPAVAELGLGTGWVLDGRTVIIMSCISVVLENLKFVVALELRRGHLTAETVLLLWILQVPSAD